MKRFVASLILFCSLGILPATEFGMKFSIGKDFIYNSRNIEIPYSLTGIEYINNNLALCLSYLYPLGARYDNSAIYRLNKVYGFDLKTMYNIIKFKTLNGQDSINISPYLTIKNLYLEYESYDYSYMYQAGIGINTSFTIDKQNFCINAGFNIAYNFLNYLQFYEKKVHDYFIYDENNNLKEEKHIYSDKSTNLCYTAADIEVFLSLIYRF